MPVPNQSHPDNAPGPWFIDTRCIRCDAARNWAPGLVGMDAAGRSVILNQPADPQQEAALWRAAAACPTRSIGNRRHPAPPPGIFPHPLADGILALGHNALSSFGAHSFLAVRPDGNLMIDAPQFTPRLAASVDDLGGVAHILLTHRDDVADYDRWAARYGARVWIGAADADAAPLATDLTDPNTITTIAPGVQSIPAPGHTAGHVVYHLDDHSLFTGDTLHWNHRRAALDVFHDQTFHSWTALADTIRMLASLKVAWIFPGHGMWHQIGPTAWQHQATTLAQAMHNTEPAAYARRPNAAYYWYQTE